MNRIVIICATILMTASIFAQTPEQMSYQAVIRDSADELVTNTQVGMQISILQGTANGSTVYVETQTPTTNVNGLVSVEIGTGITSDDFTTIDWANGPYFIKTETDPTGGTNYSITGTSQLMSVPYALYAKSAESVDETDPAYTQSEAANITASDITNLGNLSGTNTGDQDLSAYLTAETDPAYTQSEAANITFDDITNLGNLSGTNTGDQDLSGYLTVETDPAYTQSEAANITASDITNLGNLSGTNTGDQDLSGYLTAEADPEYTQSEAANITASDITNLGNLSGTNTGDQDLSGYLTAEADPAYTQSEAANITATDITNLGNLSGTNTGDQDLSGYLTSETDPAYTQSEAANITASDITNLGNLSGTNTGDQDLSGYLTAETDPAYTQSEAANITSDDITNLGNLSGTNTGDQDLSGYLTAETDPTVTTNFDLTTPADGDVLQYDASAGKWIKRTISGDITIDNTGVSAVGSDKVLTQMIADGTILAEDLATDAVETTKIKDSNITTEKIADASITSSKLADEVVTNAKIADNAVGTNKLQDASVTDAKLDKTNIPLSGFGAAQTDIDLGSNKILFANVYASESDLPSASSYHGMFAHVHGTGKAYYAHNGNWVEIANKGELNLAQVLAENNSANNQQIKNLQDPIDAQDAVTKTYVDAISPSSGVNLGDMLYWDGSSWVSIEASGNEGATLQLVGGVPQWVGVPDAPIITSVTAGDGQVDITFDAPTNDGNSTITTYTATSSPGNNTESISQAGSGTITVTGLSNGTAYTFTVTATNSVGTSSPSSASNSVTPNPQVGDYRDGGVVFYVAPTPTDLNGDGTDDLGLVCALDDQSSNAEWGCWGTPISGADGNGIGSGAANTTDILTNCSESGIAAELCDNYTGGGYSDWFLPSRDELNEMYQNKATIDATAEANGGSGLASALYWSSTESLAMYAFGFFFNHGYAGTNFKGSTYSVRAVRAF